LTAIRGYTKIVLEERAGPLNPTQREYLGIVLEKAEKLANVMTWSGSLLQRSEEDLLLTSCDLLALWAECVRKNTGSLAAKNLKLQEKLPPGRLSIACDRGKMALALEAILKYAVRSADHGGSIEIELREGSEKVLFKICHAAGAAVRELLKSVLERREPPNSTPFEDADLAALATARDIINLHGGTASIFNNDGTGLGVVFTLPNFVERSV
jgi:signal transduction histidine kinase